MRRVKRSKRYHKSLADLPEKDQDMVEAAVDRLEGDWKDLAFAPLQGTRNWWRLAIGNYRVFCQVSSKMEPLKSGLKTTMVRVQEIEADEVIRRSTTTYRKRN
jgi:mRNA-degrading endonuclease RelE of RelBE toxin-antitoxin system